MYRHYIDGQFVRLCDGAILPADSPEVAAFVEGQGRAYEAPSPDGEPEPFEVIEDAGVVAPAELAVRKATMARAVDGFYAQHLAAGLAYGGKTIQIGGQHTVNITAMAALASAAKEGHMSFPEGFAWRCADDTFMPVATADAMLLLAGAAQVRVLQLRQRQWTLKDAIGAAADHAALDAVDPGAGWS